MLFFYGKLYAITYQKQLISIVFGCCLEQTLVEKEELGNNILDWSGGSSSWRFAQSHYELLLVRQYLTKMRFCYFCIYRWDFGASGLTEVSSLGGRALFFNNVFFMVSVPPTSFGVRANCIYFPLARRKSRNPELRKEEIKYNLVRVFHGRWNHSESATNHLAKSLSSFVTWILPSMS